VNKHIFTFFCDAKSTLWDELSMPNGHSGAEKVIKRWKYDRIKETE
jgi:hypothetical protein